MRVRRLTLLLIVGGVALFAAISSRKGQEGPQVSLLHLKAADPAAPLSDPSDWLSGNIVNLRQEMWNAEFAIRNPEGSGILLSHDRVEVELLSPGGRWALAAAVEQPSLFDFSPEPETAMRITFARVKVSVPKDTRRCRLAIRFRPLTRQECCHLALAKWGLSARFPKLASWIADRMAREKHWRTYHPEIELPRVPIEQNADNIAPMSEFVPAARI
jgi:hypothetical protein